MKILTENRLRFLSLQGGCTGSSESTHVKMPHCWKSHALAHLLIPGRLAQSVTTDACLTADQGVSEFDPGPVRYFSED